jgi:catechol 2,3-dioxygenase-like lactoylglutathione lyase family enzyme
MPFKSTILVVADVLKSRKLYEKILGLRVDSDFGEFNVGFKGGLALYSQKLFSELTDSVEIKNKPNSFVVYFEFEDISTIEAKLKQEGLTFLHETREQPWGQRTFRAYDYDGHLLEIAEDMDTVLRRMFAAAMSDDEIAGKTGYALNVVSDIRMRLT